MSKKLTNLQYWLIYSAVIIVSIVIDQVTKFALEKPLETQNIPILGDFLMLSWTLNYGSAFGMFKGRSVLFFVFFLIGIPLFVFMLAYSKKRSVWGQVGFAFMFGGAVGNAIDRLILGEGFYDGPVRDFISVKGFAIFNFADSFLVVGTILACLALIFFDSDSVVSTLKALKTQPVTNTESELEIDNQAKIVSDFLDTESNIQPFAEENSQVDQDFLQTSEEESPISTDTEPDFLEVEETQDQTEPKLHKNQDEN